MTTKTAPRNESLRVRARFTVPGLPFNRIEVRTGTSHKREQRSLQVFLDKLVASENRAALQLIHEGKGAALRELKQREDDGLAIVVTEQKTGLVGALEKWLADGPVTRQEQPVRATTLSLYRQCVTQLANMLDAERQTAIEAANGNTRKLNEITANELQVSDLPDVLARYRVQCGRLKHFRPFMLARDTCAVFAANTEMRGRNSALYKAIREVPPLDAPRKRERNASLTVAGVIGIMQKMTEQGNGHLSEHVWRLACIGARPREYCRDAPDSPSLIEWDAGTDSVRIRGQKTKHADRFCPCSHKAWPVEENYLVWRTGKLSGRRAEKGKQPYYTYRTFASAFNKAAPGYEVYDLRGTSQRWMLAAGVESGWISRFHGHVPTSLQAMYTSVQFPPVWDEWDAAIAEATEKLHRWMEQQLKNEGQTDVKKRVWGAKSNEDAP